MKRQAQNLMTYGLFLSFAAYAAYAISDACVKFIHGGLPPYEIGFYGALSGLLVLPLIKDKGESWRVVYQTKSRPLWLLRTFCAGVGVIGSVTAFTYLSMAEAFTLIFLQPVLVTLLSVPVLKERIGWRRSLAVALGFAGVLVVLRPGFRELSIGHLGAFVAGLGSAVTILIFRVLSFREKRLTLYASGLAGPIVICGLLTFFNHIMPTAAQWGYIAGYGLFAALGGILLIVAAQYVSAIGLATPKYSQMIWAVVFGAVFFHDRIDGYIILGSLLIIASSIFTFLREEKRKTPLPHAITPPTSALEQSNP